MIWSGTTGVGSKYSFVLVVRQARVKTGAGSKIDIMQIVNKKTGERAEMGGRQSINVKQTGSKTQQGTKNALVSSQWTKKYKLYEVHVISDDFLQLCK